MAHQFEVPQETNALDALKEQYPDSSSNTLRQWIRSGRLMMGEKPVSYANTMIPAGTQLSLEGKTEKKKAERIRGLKIVHEDEHLIVVDKPAGLLSVATDRGNQANAHSLLKEHCKPGRVYPVHRLDRGTSGLLMFARTEEARDGLKKQLEERSVQRVYIAVVEGSPEDKDGTWESYLKEGKDLVVRGGREREGAKWARTQWLLLKSGPSYSLLRVRIDTGRKNQIRVHCSEAGYPVAGDKKYGATSDPVRRLCLHAETLGFVHPVTGEELHFKSRVPGPFDKAIKA